MKCRSFSTIVLLTTFNIIAITQHFIFTDVSKDPLISTQKEYNTDGKGESIGEGKTAQRVPEAKGIAVETRAELRGLAASSADRDGARNLRSVRQSSRSLSLSLTLVPPSSP